jgi:hypothetical protein
MPQGDFSIPCRKGLKERITLDYMQLSGSTSARTSWLPTLQTWFSLLHVRLFRQLAKLQDGKHWLAAGMSVCAINLVRVGILESRKHAPVHFV